MCEPSFYSQIHELETATNNLNSIYRKLRFSVISLFFLSLCIAIVLAISVKIPSFAISTRFIVSRTLFITIGIIGYSVLILIRNKIVIKHLNKFCGLYKEALKLCNGIVDTSDWTNLRKRALSDNKRQSVMQTVDNFYNIREQYFFPGRTEKSVWPRIILFTRLFQTIIMLELAIYIGYCLYTDIFS